MVLVIVVVNQSIMGWPLLQDKLSTQTGRPQLDLRQSLSGKNAVSEGMRFEAHFRGDINHRSKPNY